MNLKTLFILFR